MQISAEELKTFMEQTCGTSYVELGYHARVFNEIKVMSTRNIFDALKNISILSCERSKIFDSFLPYISMESIPLQVVDHGK